MAEKVNNCMADVPAEKGDIDPGDNSFHCPTTGAWVELGEDEDGKIVCISGCDLRTDSHN